MTPLIDVIFLLLLFFMLTSTFSRYGEIALTVSGAGQAGQDSAVPPLFVRVAETALTLNGRDVDIEGLETALRARAGGDGPQPVLISLRRAVTAQRLTDVLVAVRGVPGLRPSVLGGP